MGPKVQGSECEFRRKRAGYTDAKRATIPTLKWASVPT
jgi:hypothetical protein